MRIRTAALVGVWALALGLATTVSWAGVDLVGSEVSPSGTVPLSQAQVENRIHAASGASATSPSTSLPAGASDGTPSAQASAGTPAQQSVVVQGGTVVLVCTGDRLSAKTSPSSGYAVSEDSRPEGSTVQITFSNASHRSQVNGTCRAGAPSVGVREIDHAGDD